MVKGSSKVDLSEPIKKIIAQIDELAEKKFPLDETFAVLTQLDCTVSDLEPYVFYAIDCYTRNLVHRAATYELMLLCWMPGQKTPIHGHEGEKCWMRVIEGSLQAINYSKVSSEGGFLLKPDELVPLEAGSVNGPAFINQIINASDEKAISLHVCSKPLYACDVFEINQEEKKRMNLSFFSMFGKIELGFNTESFK